MSLEPLLLAFPPLPEVDIIYILAVFCLCYPFFFTARLSGPPGSRGRRARVGALGFVLPFLSSLPT